jgi:hypothetical protein
MRSQTEHVLQSLFSEVSLNNISVEHLRQIVDEHPYFTLGHLFLAKKLQTISASEYEAQSEKTSLYFNEPIWLQTLLHPSDEQMLTYPESIARTEPVGDAPIHAEEAIKQQDVNEPEADAIESQSIVAAPPVVESETVDIAAANRQSETIPSEITSIATESPSAEKEKNDNQAEEQPQVFEPYHTVDYFASQGIKISNEIRPDDRLGRQLRSFTEWLKTMKRLPETQAEQQLDEVTQQNIQDFAAHSLDEKEIVTESMAEVLLKQNRIDEGIAMYEKLSLLNPSKRAYFAAKIEQLKGS